MYKIIFVLTLFVCLQSFCVQDLSKIVKVETNNRYPFALITQDFGILNTSDLAMSSCESDPVAFSSEPNSYPYWQCFPISQIKFKCDPAGMSDETKKETALLLIDVLTQKGKHQYIPRRAMEMSNCKWFHRKWKKVTRQQKFVCLSGLFSGFDKATDHSVSIWVFDKFKTKKGCESYFYGGCSESYARKNGCKF